MRCIRNKHLIIINFAETKFFFSLSQYFALIDFECIYLKVIWFNRRVIHLILSFGSPADRSMISIESYNSRIVWWIKIGYDDFQSRTLLRTQNLVWKNPSKMYSILSQPTSRCNFTISIFNWTSLFKSQMYIRIFSFVQFQISEHAMNCILFILLSLCMICYIARQISFNNVLTYSLNENNDFIQRSFLCVRVFLIVLHWTHCVLYTENELLNAKYPLFIIIVWLILAFHLSMFISFLTKQKLFCLLICLFNYFVNFHSFGFVYWIDLRLSAETNGVFDY